MTASAGPALGREHPMRSFLPPRTGIADRRPTARAGRPLAGVRPAQVLRRFPGGTVARREAPAPAAPGLPAANGLPEGLRTVMEAMSGFSLADVVVHRNSAEPGRLGAAAFTKGNRIHLAPGQERHLPHEAWHVVQQAQGRVAPTLQMKGVAVNDDAGLEREADVMGARAAASPACGAGAGSAPALAEPGPTSAAIQCKGPVPLAETLAKAALPKTAELLTKGIDAYDKSAEGRPAAQLEMLRDIKRELDAWQKTHSATASKADKEGIKALTEVLAKEIQIVDDQAKRLETFTASDEAPYEQMTSEGLLWKHEKFGSRVSTGWFATTGFQYFQKLSGSNVEGMASEVTSNKLGQSPWFGKLEKNALTALQGAVLRHYTTAVRAAVLTKEGLNSRMVLEKTKPQYRHNTSTFDDFALSNSGFVFFFIEDPDAPPRDTRFAKSSEGEDEGSARITVPIAASGLLKTGWVMLSDFAQREYPTVRTDKGNKEIQSELATRQKKVPKEFDVKVREFKRATASDKEAKADVEEMTKTPRPQRELVGTVNALVRGDTRDRQVYSSPTGGTHEVRETISSNILVGGDILGGLARRAALEVARISHASPELGKTLQVLSGDKLLRFILKDLFRPQAMIPNGVKIDKKYVEIIKEPAIKAQQSLNDKKPEEPQTDKTDKGSSASTSSPSSTQAPKGNEHQPSSAPEKTSSSFNQGKTSGDRKALAAWGISELEKVRALWQKQSKSDKDPRHYADRIAAVRSIFEAPENEPFERLELVVRESIEGLEAACKPV
jgi:hypothetical protein